MLIGTILKYCFLACAITYTFCNVAKALRGHNIPSGAIWSMSISIAAYLALEFQTNF